MRKKNPKLYEIKNLEFFQDRFWITATTPMYDYTIQRKPYSDGKLVYRNNEFVAEAYWEEEAIQLANEDFVSNISSVLLPYKIKKEWTIKRLGNQSKS